MQWQLLFLSIPPLVAYMALYAAGRPRAAIAAAVLVAALELLYNSLQLGIWEPFSLLSLTLYVVLGAVSLERRDDRFFKLQPVAFELSVAAVLIYFRVALDTAFFALVLEEHLGLHLVIESYQRGYATVYATTLSRSMPFLLVLHAGLTAHAALSKSTWWWFNFRVFGLYAMVAVLFVGERLLGVTA